MYSDWVADYTLADNFGEDNAIFSGQEFQKLVQQGRKHWKKNMSFVTTQHPYRKLLVNKA